MKPSEELLKQELQIKIRGQILENEPLKERTTYKIGGAAKYLVFPKDLEDLRTLNDLIRKHQLPKFVLGGGANVLVSDGGFEGIVVNLKNFGQLKFDKGKVSAGAGLILDQFVVACQIGRASCRERV